jgi:xanthine dehydrogenase accessory factor
VSADSVVGSIGGGHLELVAIEQARTLLAGRAALPASSSSTTTTIPTPIDRDIALGPSLGQCCGGSLTLRQRWLDPAALAAWPAAATPGLIQLQIHGAGHVGRAIVKLLEGIDCQVDWVDLRESEFPPAASPAHIRRCISDCPEAEVASAPPGSHFLVLTHSHELDLRITEAILKRADFAWLGLIGSATKRARFMHRFEQRGIAPALLARLTCPIGLPGINGKQPEVIAIAVVAQLLGLPSSA